jgi:hypothetical protein
MRAAELYDGVACNGFAFAAGPICMACSLREPALHLLDGWGDLWVPQKFQEHLREGLLTPQSNTSGCCCRCRVLEVIGDFYVVLCLNTELASPAAAAEQDIGVSAAAVIYQALVLHTWFGEAVCQAPTDRSQPVCLVRNPSEILV